MLDTLKVYTPEFTVKDGAKVSVLPGVLNYETGDQNDFELFRDQSGRSVYGSKAFVNCDKYQLTIKSMPKGGVQCFIQSSIPKVIKNDNYSPLTEKETKQAIQVIQGDLHNKGISLNLNNCKVSRIDAFKNITGNEPFMTYSPLFSRLRSKRQHKRDYGTTFTWENTQREVCVYDKLTEMQSRGMAISGYPENTIRFEYRLKNARVCEKETGYGTVKELVNNLEGVRKIYLDALENSIFSMEVDQVRIMGAQELEAGLEVYKSEIGRNWAVSYLRDYGAYSIAKLAGIETVRDVFSRAFNDRVKAWRFMQVFETGKRNFDLIEAVKGGKTLGDLYSELKEKVCIKTE